jgi:hypothetical protein
VIVYVVDFPASIPPVRSGGTPMVVGGAFATHQLRPKSAIEAPRIRVHANLPRERFLSNRCWRSLTRCLPVSCVHVATRSGTLRVLHAHVLGSRTNGANRWQEPSLRIARGETRTVLFRERCDVRPERPKSYCKRRAKCPSARSKRRSDRERARNSHTSFAAAIVCVRVRQELRAQSPLLASFDARTV